MKKIVLFTFILTVFLIAPAVMAEGVNVFPSAKEVVGYTGQTVSADITMQNLQNKNDRFAIMVWPSRTAGYWEGVVASLERSPIDVNANSNQTVKIYFTIELKTNEQISSFAITVKSVNNDSVTDTQTLNLRVVRTVPIYIPVGGVKLNKYNVNPSDTVVIETSVMNLYEEPYTQASVETSIIRGNEIVKRFDSSISLVPGGATKKIETIYSLDKYASPGDYDVEVVLKDSGDRIVSSKTLVPAFVVNTVPKITQEGFVNYGFLIQTVIIKVKNEGNVINNSVVKVNIPKFLQPFFTPQGSPAMETNGDVSYHWLLPLIAPGEEREIRYEIDLRATVFGVCIIIVILIFAFNYAFTPKIVKLHLYTGPIAKEREIVVSLDVRNRSRHEIKDVTVKDFVPSIARVIERFDTIKPMLRTKAGGTEVMWLLESLKPGEERVLTYRVKPVVDVIGSLKLPKASISYFDKKKKMKSTASKSIIIKPE